MMSESRKVFTCWRWYRCVSFEILHLPIGCLRRRGGSLRAVMMVMMMTKKNYNKYRPKHVEDKNCYLLVMMVMSVSLGPLGPADRRDPTSTIFIALAVLVLGLPSFASRARLRRSVCQ